MYDSNRLLDHEELRYWEQLVSVGLAASAAAYSADA